MGAMNIQKKFRTGKDVDGQFSWNTRKDARQSLWVEDLVTDYVSFAIIGFYSPYRVALSFAIFGFPRIDRYWVGLANPSSAMLRLLESFLSYLAQNDTTNH